MTILKRMHVSFSIQMNIGGKEIFSLFFFFFEKKNLKINISLTIGFGHYLFPIYLFPLVSTLYLH